jgi:Niemann-Pick C1 protein
MAVFIDFLLQMTAFLALIVLDFRRTEDGRVECVPCIQFEREKSSGNKSCWRHLVSAVTLMLKADCCFDFNS